MVDKDKTVEYTCEVIDGEDGPRFVVTAEDKPDEPIVGASPTGAWTMVIKSEYFHLVL